MNNDEFHKMVLEGKIASEADTSASKPSSFLGTRPRTTGHTALGKHPGRKPDRLRALQHQTLVRQQVLNRGRPDGPEDTKSKAVRELEELLQQRASAPTDTERRSKASDGREDDDDDEKALDSILAQTVQPVAKAPPTEKRGQLSTQQAPKRTRDEILAEFRAKRAQRQKQESEANPVTVKSGFKKRSRPTESATSRDERPRGHGAHGRPGPPTDPKGAAAAVLGMAVPEAYRERAEAIAKAEAEAAGTIDGDGGDVDIFENASDYDPLEGLGESSGGEDDGSSRGEDDSSEDGDGSRGCQGREDGEETRDREADRERRDAHHRSSSSSSRREPSRSRSTTHSPSSSKSRSPLSRSRDSRGPRSPSPSDRPSRRPRERRQSDGLIEEESDEEVHDLLQHLRRASDPEGDRRPRDSQSRSRSGDRSRERERHGHRSRGGRNSREDRSTGRRRDGSQDRRRDSRSRSRSRSRDRSRDRKRHRSRRDSRDRSRDRYSRDRRRDPDRDRERVRETEAEKQARLEQRLRLLQQDTGRDDVDLDLHFGTSRYADEQDLDDHEQADPPRDPRQRKRRRK